MNIVKYFKKLLKQEEIKSRLLNDFGIKNFSLIKESNSFLLIFFRENKIFTS